MHLLYKFKCGCIKSNFKNIHCRVKHGVYSNRKLCPTHPVVGEGDLVGRIVECVDCGCDLHAEPAGSPPQRCDKCKKEHTNKLSRRHMRKVKAEKVEREKNVVKINPNNTFNCKKFSDMCGTCIRPYFQCKMFSKAS